MFEGVRAGAGIGFVLSDLALGGTEAIPLLGNGLSVLTLTWDAIKAVDLYNTCMAGR